MENKKIALIVEGGGQRGVFSFGITDTFIKRKYDPFDIYIGVSNGVAVLYWYLIRETANNLDKMLYAASGNYFSYKDIFTGKDIFKVHQMYSDGEKKFKPNIKKITNNLNGKDFIAVVTDALEANAEYHSFEENEWLPKMIASGTLPVLVRTPSLINGRRKFDGGIADPLPAEKAYALGAKKIIVIRTYEKKFRRKLKLENYIGALLSRKYPKLRKALLEHDKTYNRALNFINNPPKDCEIIQLCPPEKLKSKRDSKNIVILKEDYELGRRVAENYLERLENLKN
jgi:predicted patatin/cPLA2 family phospholipase